MFRRAVLLGLTSGVLAGIACLIYAHIYNDAMGSDFAKVVKPPVMISLCILASMIAALLYTGLTNLLKNNGEIVFNFVFVLATFGTIVIPFAINLPLDIHSPELFPGLVIPMHFFPALGWFTLKPLFIKN